jgi:DNA-binding winged helix-turn-helix (wHTH) protein
MNAHPIDLPREPDFQLGGLRVRPAVREIAGPAGAETLEPRVMEVLVALARADGEAVSRDALIAACWSGRIVGEDAIQRCVQRLRKVQEVHGGFAIETKPKIG